MTPENLKQKAYLHIVKLIRSGDIQPNQTIVESNICKDLNISRTPVRHAFQTLEQEGILHLIPNKGAVLKVPSFKEAWEIYQIREALEPLAAMMCIDRFTSEELDMYLEKIIESKANPSPELLQIGDDFHGKIIFYCGNEHLINFLTKLRILIGRLQMFTHRLPGRISRSIIEHERILNAIAERNGQLARQRMQEHIVSLKDSTFNMLKDTSS